MATREDSRKTRDALRAARLYYQQELTMGVIAAEMHTSRSTVSRLLDHARDTGLVTITVHTPADSTTKVERQLHARYGISTYLVPVPTSANDVDRHERVCLAAARLIDRWIESNMVIGIAWGSTLTNISRHLAKKALDGVQFVQLNGAGNTHTSGIVYASEILRRFADAYSSVSQQFPVPAFFDDPATKAAVWRERSTRRILELQKQLDLIIFSPGDPRSVLPSRVYAAGYLDPEDFDELIADDVAGDVATVFYREDGSYDGIAMNDRATGPDLGLLRAVPRRVAVVTHPSKYRSLRGALASGLVTDLIADESTARSILPL